MQFKCDVVRSDFQPWDVGQEPRLSQSPPSTRRDSCAFQDALWAGSHVCPIVLMAGKSLSL